MLHRIMFLQEHKVTVLQWFGGTRASSGHVSARAQGNSTTMGGTRASSAHVSARAQGNSTTMVGGTQFAS